MELYVVCSVVVTGATRVLNPHIFFVAPLLSCVTSLSEVPLHLKALGLCFLTGERKVGEKTETKEIA